MLVGVAFAFGWTPCIGPILRAILAVAAAQDSVGEGVKLLAVYSAGLGVPFIATSLAINKFFAASARIRKHYHTIEVVSGVLMVVVGVLIFTNRFTVIAQLLTRTFQPSEKHVPCGLQERCDYCLRLCYILVLDEFATDTHADRRHRHRHRAHRELSFSRTSTTDINGQRSSADAVRAQAAALSATIADVRGGQFAYVARGQGEAFWMSHVESLIPALQKQAAELGASLASPAAQSAFEPVAAALENFRTLDTKVREFVRSGNSLLAADMIFSDGLESTTTASTQLTAALNEELQHRTARIAALRSRQLAVLGGGAGVILLLMIGLAFNGKRSEQIG